MTAKDNRRSKRTSHDSVLELFDDSGKLIAAVGQLVNVSSVGACFSCVRSLAKGEKIYARLRLLKEGFLEVTGHVVWIQKKLNTIQYGVAFDDVRPLGKRH